jgi:hypothetical protein
LGLGYAFPALAQDGDMACNGLLDQALDFLSRVEPTAKQPGRSGTLAP